MPFKGLRPLRRVLRASPCAPVLCHVFDRALPKGTPSGVGKPLRLPLDEPRLQRIDAALAALPVLSGQRASIRQRNIREAAQPHVAACAADLKAEHPGSRARLRHPKVEAAAIM